MSFNNANSSQPKDSSLHNSRTFSKQDTLQSSSYTHSHSQGQQALKLSKKNALQQKISVSEFEKKIEKFDQCHNITQLKSSKGNNSSSESAPSGVPSPKSASDRDHKKNLKKSMSMSGPDLLQHQSRNQHSTSTTSTPIKQIRPS